MSICILCWAPMFPIAKRSLALIDAFSLGTLRYVLLTAALMTPRPPTLMVLNEPETSLHPNLLEPQARLIVAAARNSQLWVTTHSSGLADQIVRLSGSKPIHLTKLEGETRIRDQQLDDPEEDS